jgi:hypothetical protein
MGDPDDCFLGNSDPAGFLSSRRNNLQVDSKRARNYPGPLASTG